MTVPTFAIHTINLRLAFLYSTHPEIVPPPYTAPVIPTHPFVEVPHILFWGPGAGMTSPKVLFDGFTPAQQGHDSGIGIIHVGVPPGPLSVVATATSFFKCVFGAGTVLAEGKPTAGHFPPLINMLQCFAPVPLPIGGVLLFKNTVFVGLTWMDILMGIVRIAIAIVIALVFNKLGNSTGRMGQAWERVGNLGNRLGASGFWNVLGNNILSNFCEDVAKIPLGIVMEGKVQLPFQIAELDLTNGQFKVFYWNVGGEHYHVSNYSVSGGLRAAQDQVTAPPGGSPMEQATQGVPTLGE